MILYNIYVCTKYFVAVHFLCEFNVSELRKKFSKMYYVHFRYQVIHYDAACISGINYVKLVTQPYILSRLLLRFMLTDRTKMRPAWKCNFGG